jgi:hypothetical protein
MMKDASGKNLTLPEAKANLAAALDRVTPTLLIEAHPLRCAAFAVCVGAVIGVSGAARRTVAALADIAASIAVRSMR